MDQMFRVDLAQVGTWQDEGPQSMRVCVVDHREAKDGDGHPDNFIQYIRVQRPHLHCGICSRDSQRYTTGIHLFNLFWVRKQIQKRTWCLHSKNFPMISLGLFPLNLQSRGLKCSSIVRIKVKGKASVGHLPSHDFGINRRRTGQGETFPVKEERNMH